MFVCTIHAGVVGLLCFYVRLTKAKECIHDPFLAEVGCACEVRGGERFLDNLCCRGVISLCGGREGGEQNAGEV